MPKRKVESLNGLRLEINSKERELFETAIYVNGFGKTMQGMGTAIGGLGLAGGLIIGAALFGQPVKDALDGAVDWVKDKADLGKQEWLDENITQPKYDEYINERENIWKRAADRMGLYAPALLDVTHPDNPTLRRVPDGARNIGLTWGGFNVNNTGGAGSAMRGAPYTFSEWETDESQPHKGEPPMTFAEWEVDQRNAEVRKRKSIVGVLFPWLIPVLL